MIDLIVKNVFQNSTRIDNVVKVINKTNKRNLAGVLMLSISIWSIAKMVEKHDKKINELEAELEVMKSKLA